MAWAPRSKVRLCDACTGVPHGLENAPPVGPYRRLMTRVLGESRGGWMFLVGEVPLYHYVSHNYNAHTVNTVATHVMASHSQ